MVILWVLVSLATLFSALALVFALFVAKRVAERDPSAVSAFWRRLLRVRWTTLDDVPAGAEHRDGQRIAFVANPTKRGVAQIRERAVLACSVRYLPQPMWFLTSPDDPGTGAAKAAIEAGADVVVAIGGDGTVRAVAEALAGTDVALGIVPVGTGNLFARNMELPIEQPGALIGTALDGEERRVDVGWLRKDDTGEEVAFLIIAGIGLDAEMVAGANASLKKRLGWAAYFFSAIKHLGDKRMEATVTVDGSEEVSSQMRSVLFGNVGRLPGGLQLIPDAEIDDGHLDILTLDAKGGLVGWSELFGSVVVQSATSNQNLLNTPFLREIRTSRIDHITGTEATVRTTDQRRVQVDGEDLGLASGVSVWIQPDALTVRVAKQAKS